MICQYRPSGESSASLPAMRVRSWAHRAIQARNGMEDLDGSLTALNGIALELLELATAVVKSGDETSVMWVTAKDFAAIAAGVP